jgi:hypothetical protein
MTVFRVSAINPTVEALPPADLDLEFKSPQPCRSRKGSDMLLSHYLHLCNALEWNAERTCCFQMSDS